MVTMILITIINDFKKSYEIIQEKLALLENLKNYFCKRLRKRDVGWGDSSVKLLPYRD